MNEAPNKKIDWVLIPPEKRGNFPNVWYMPDIDMKPGETLDEAVRRHNEKINAPVARTD